MIESNVVVESRLAESDLLTESVVLSYDVFPLPQASKQIERMEIRKNFFIFLVF